MFLHGDLDFIRCEELVTQAQHSCTATSCWMEQEGAFKWAGRPGAAVPPAPAGPRDHLTQFCDTRVSLALPFKKKKYFH